MIDFGIEKRERLEFYDLAMLVYVCNGWSLIVEMEYRGIDNVEPNYHPNKELARLIIFLKKCGKGYFRFFTWRMLVLRNMIREKN